jgi:hypothetical protein
MRRLIQKSSSIAHRSMVVAIPRSAVQLADRSGSKPVHQGLRPRLPQQPLEPWQVVHRQHRRSISRRSSAAIRQSNTPVAHSRSAAPTMVSWSSPVLTPHGGHDGVDLGKVDP